MVTPVRYVAEPFAPFDFYALMRPSGISSKLPLPSGLSLTDMSMAQMVYLRAGIADIGFVNGPISNNTYSRTDARSSGHETVPKALLVERRRAPRKSRELRSMRLVNRARNHMMLARRSLVR